MDSHLHIVLSTISYLRNFFSESAFREEKRDGIKLKILIESQETRTFCTWLRDISSVIDSLEKILLGLFDGETLCEIYEIRPREILKYRDLCVFLQSIVTNTDAETLRIKIYLSKNVKKGALDGPGLIVLDEWTRENRVWSIERKKVFENYGIKIIILEQERKENTAGLICLDSANITPRIACVCRLSKVDSDLVECASCKQFSHTLCIGFFSCRDVRIPRLYQCYKCIKITCKDRHHEDLNNFLSEPKNLAVYRNILRIWFSEGPVNRPELKNRLQISDKSISQMYKQLREDEFIPKTRGKDGLLLPVCDIAQVKRKIKKYFNADSLECWMGVQNTQLMKDLRY